MIIKKEAKRLMLQLFCLAILAFLGLGTWAVADGPVADFPSFIPFDIAKTGDVAVDKVGNVYVNITEKTTGLAKIWKFTPTGEGPFEVADLGIGAAYGLAVKADGEIYAAVRTGIYSAVYRVDRNENVFLLPGTDQIVWANSLAFDQRGNLYITESYSLDSPSMLGGIWRIPPGGEAEIWLRDELLTGVGAAPTGANGIAFYLGDIYVVNSNKNLIVRVPVLPDGSPGEPDVWTEIGEVPETPEALRQALPLTGDGLAFDVHGNAYIAMVTRSAVVRINAEDLSQETIAVIGYDPNASLFAPLDIPNSLAFGTGKGARQSLFITNLGMVNAALRGMVKIDAGVPGLPLP